MPGDGVERRAPARHAGDEGLHRGQRSSLARTGARGHVEPGERAPQPALDVIHGGVEGLAEFLNLLSGHLSEAEADDDRLAQPSHLAGQVHGLAVPGQDPPALDQLGDGVRGHRPEVSVEGGPEGDLDLATAAAPAIAVHHGEALAEERAHAARGGALGVKIRTLS